LTSIIRDASASIKGRIRAALKQDFHDGEISRANRLVERRHIVAIPRIDRGTLLDQQRGDTRSRGTIRASQICDPVKRRLAKSIGRGGARSAIEEVSDDLSVE